MSEYAGNPNSSNQWWSKWIFTVRPGRVMVRPFEEVKLNVARFARKAFGSTSHCRITQKRSGYIVEVLTERHPVHDPTFKEYMLKAFADFFQAGFGLDTVTKGKARLMAGSRQDGTPADQMLIMPLFKWL